MTTFLIRRLFLLVPVLLGVSTLTFFLLHLTPGDPVDIMLGEGTRAVDRDAMRLQLGLAKRLPDGSIVDRPLHEQYARYLAGLVRGDLGISSKYQPRGVASLIAERYPRTALLAAAALGLAVALAVPLGVLAALRQGTWVDSATMVFALVGIAMPSFWLGPLLVMFFAVELKLLPVAGASSLQHLILPSVTLGLGLMALLTRMSRASVLETLREDYVRTAKAKGLGHRAVVFKHALRNALVPIITVIGLQFGALLAGTVITEKIFSWPGVGLLLFEGIGSRDIPVVQGCVLVIATTYVLVNLLTDVVYAWVDPRISVA